MKFLLVGTAWLSTAAAPLSAEESVLRLVEPADRPQQQSIDEARAPLPAEPVAKKTTSKSTNPFHRAANQWLTKIGRPLLDERIVPREAPAAIDSAPQQYAVDYTIEPTVEMLPPEFSSALSPIVEPVAQLENSNQTGGSDPNCYLSKPLFELNTYIGLPQGKLPANAAAECAAVVPIHGDRRQDLGWAMTDFNWSATCMHHRPLYFEEENLERHGYTASCRFQPIISGAKFFFNIPLLPYKMALDPPRSCVYTLGYYRPGSCAPRHWHRLPLKVGASVVEASVIVGLVFLIP